MIFKNIVTIDIFTIITKELIAPIIGTFLITFFSVLIATPAGIITGIFISEYSNGRLKEIFIFIFKMLSSFPSILFGLFGFILILFCNKIFGTHLKTCFLISSLSLSLLILPYIVHATIVGLYQIEDTVRTLPLTLGAKKYQAIFKVYIKEAFPLINSGVALAIGRAAEDTAVIMLTGAAAYAGLPSSLFSPFEALPFFIFYSSQENVTGENIKIIYLAALIIVLISSFFIILSRKQWKK
jgi:phosphate transport system permease protein